MSDDGTFGQLLRLSERNVALEKEIVALRRALQACEKAMQNERSQTSGQWVGRGPGSHFTDTQREARACLAAISQTEG